MTDRFAQIKEAAAAKRAARRLCEDRLADDRIEQEVAAKIGDIDALRREVDALRYTEGQSVADFISALISDNG